MIYVFIVHRICELPLLLYRGKHLFDPTFPSSLSQVEANLSGHSVSIRAKMYPTPIHMEGDIGFTQKVRPSRHYWGK